MKYIYYVIAIMVMVTLLTAFKLLNIKVEVQNPALIINDRVISEKELDQMVRTRPDSYHTAEALESIITNQLLIQEAVKKGINKEESFRSSIENYYEQSLVKVLIDRKFKTLNPEIQEKMINLYIEFSTKSLLFTKRIYPTPKDIKKGNTAFTEHYNTNFEDLSDDLKYLFLQLKPGETSPPKEDGLEIATYTLDGTEKSSKDVEPETDINTIRQFLMDQEKGILFEKWMKSLKESATINILTDRTFN